MRLGHREAEAARTPGSSRGAASRAAVGDDDLGGACGGEAVQTRAARRLPACPPGLFSPLSARSPLAFARNKDVSNARPRRCERLLLPLAFCSPRRRRRPIALRADLSISTGLLRLDVVVAPLARTAKLARPRSLAPLQRALFKTLSSVVAWACASPTRLRLVRSRVIRSSDRELAGSVGLGDVLHLAPNGCSRLDLHRLCTASARRRRGFWSEASRTRGRTTASFAGAAVLLVLAASCDASSSLRKKLDKSCGRGRGTERTTEREMARRSVRSNPARGRRAL